MLISGKLYIIDKYTSISFKLKIKLGKSKFIIYELEKRRLYFVQ